MNPLLFNFLLYLIALIISIRTNKRFINAHSFTIFIFTCVAFLGYYTFETGIYEETFGKKNIERLSYIPYLLSFIVIIAFCKPLKYIKVESISQKNLLSKKKLLKIALLLLANVILSIGLFSLTLKNRTALDYAEVYAESASGDMITTTGSKILDSIYGKTLLITRISTPFFYFICFYFLSKQTYVKKAILMILLHFSIQLPQFILNANRGGMFFCAMHLCFFIVLFYYKLSKNIKRTIFSFVIVGFAFVVFYSLIITYARMGDGSEGVNSILRYFGEPFPNLGFNIWDHEIRHPYGARFYPSLAEMLGFKTLSADTLGRNIGFLYWGNYVGIPMLNFKTVFGDLYIEFGLFLTLLFTILYSKIATTFCKKKELSLFSSAYLFLPYKWALMGVFGWGLKEREFLDLAAMIILIYLLNFAQRYERSRHHYPSLQRQIFSSSIDLSV